MTMAKKSAVLVVIGLLLAAAAPGASEARVVRFVVEQTRAFAGGMSFGDVGPYERLDGTAYMEADPRDPLNAVVVNLDRAPRNARGMVEFSAPFFILKPVDMARGNRKIFYTVNNRGGPLAIDFAHPLMFAQTAADVGDNDIALQMGFTIVDAGWEGDVIQRFSAAGTPLNLAAGVPVARQPDGSAITGLM